MFCMAFINILISKLLYYLKIFSLICIQLLNFSAHFYSNVRYIYKLEEKHFHFNYIFFLYHALGLLVE